MANVSRSVALIAPTSSAGRPSAVPVAAVMLLSCGWFCCVRSAEPKKKVRSFTSGPPSDPPKSCRSNCGFGTLRCFESGSIALNSVLRKYPYADPLNRLDPDLVTALTMPPIARPNSAVPPRPITWNSPIASWLYFWRGKVKDSSVFQKPSTSSAASFALAPAMFRPIPCWFVLTFSTVPGVSSAKSR